MKVSPTVQLNLNVRGMPPSATVAINERSNALRAEGREIFKLGLGQSPFPVPHPVVEALRAAAPEKDYLPVKGLPALRAAVADYHRLSDGIQRTGEDVLIGPGSKELMFLLQLVYYGDLVIPTPAWVSYAPQARILSRHVRMLPTRAEDNWRLSPEGLQALCEEDPSRPRVVILNYPSNPTGGTYGVDDLKALAEVAAEHGVVLLSDEIYGEVHHHGEHVSIARYYPEGTIVSAGLSKWCGAGGWRLGTFLFPPEMRWLQDAMAAAASETFTSTSAPIQYAAVRAFKKGAEIESYLVKSRKVLRALGNYCARVLNEVGVACTYPEGGFYLMPDFSGHRERLAARGITTGSELCARLLEDTGVAILPGCEFGCRDEELNARMAYVDFDGGSALAAVSSRDPAQTPDEAFLHHQCAPVVDAMQRLCEWVNKG